MTLTEHDLTRGQLAAMFSQRGYRFGAEIGVRQGVYSETLCRAIPGLRLLCVDAWQYYPANPKMYSQDRHDRNYAMTVERLQPYDVEIRRVSSLEAAPHVRMASLDFVYIDANHQLAYVLDDLLAWTPRVRSGGVVSGDDFDAPGVREALDIFTREHGIETVHVLNDRGRRNRRGEYFRSWWFERP